MPGGNSEHLGDLTFGIKADLSGLKKAEDGLKTLKGSIDKATATTIRLKADTSDVARAIKATESLQKAAAKPVRVKVDTSDARAEIRELQAELSSLRASVGRARVQGYSGLKVSGATRDDWNIGSGLTTQARRSLEGTPPPVPPRWWGTPPPPPYGDGDGGGMGGMGRGRGGRGGFGRGGFGGGGGGGGGGGFGGGRQFGRPGLLQEFMGPPSATGLYFSMLFGTMEAAGLHQKFASLERLTNQMPDQSKAVEAYVQAIRSSTEGMSSGSVARFLSDFTGITKKGSRSIPGKLLGPLGMIFGKGTGYDTTEEALGAAEFTARTAMEAETRAKKAKLETESLKELGFNINVGGLTRNQQDRPAIYGKILEGDGMGVLGSIRRQAALARADHRDPVAMARAQAVASAGSRNDQLRSVEDTLIKLGLGSQGASPGGKLMAMFRAANQQVTDAEVAHVNDLKAEQTRDTQNRVTVAGIMAKGQFGYAEEVGHRLAQQAALDFGPKDPARRAELQQMLDAENLTRSAERKAQAQDMRAETSILATARTQAGPRAALMAIDQSEREALRTAPHEMIEPIQARAEEERKQVRQDHRLQQELGRISFQSQSAAYGNMANQQHLLASFALTGGKIDAAMAAANGGNAGLPGILGGGALNPLLARDPQAFVRAAMLGSGQLAAMKGDILGNFKYGSATSFTAGGLDLSGTDSNSDTKEQSETLKKIDEKMAELNRLVAAWQFLAQ